MIRILDAQALREAIDFRACVEAMRNVFTEVADGRFHAPLRTRVRPALESVNGMTLMPSLRLDSPRRWCLKEMVVTPINPSRGLDPLQGVVILHDGADGRVMAIADAPQLTAIRTAATTALATLTLARPVPKTVAVIGSGVQGRAHLQAMKSVFPGVELRLWGRNAANCSVLAADVGCRVFATVESAVRDADVVCTVTAAVDPVLESDWISSGCHINAIGSSTPVACEIAPALTARANLFVDRRDAALAESGDVRRALAHGAILEDHIQAELGEVLHGRHPGRRTREEVTLYKSLGFGALDLAALELALDSAEARNLGVSLEWNA